MGGFCGQSIRVRLSLNIEGLSSQKVDVNDFVFICEIRPGNEPRISAQTVVRKAAVMDKVRSKQDKDIGKELFMGEVQSYDQHDKELDLEVVFNGRHHSWDYSWKSNRWSEQQHVVDIIVLTYESPLDFRVAGHYTSSQFMILSSHKKSVKGGSTSDKPSTVTLPAGRKPSSKATPSRDSNGTLASSSSGSSQGADLADQDLLDASNALSMLAGGCMLPSATAPAAGQSEGKAAGEDDDDEDDDDEDEDEEDDGDEHKKHPRTFASASSEMVVLPSRPTVVVKPGPAATTATTATAAVFPSATALAMAGSVPSTDLLRLQMNNSSTSTRPLALSDLHQLAFPSKSATSPSQEPVSSTERRHETNDGSTKIATDVKPADVVLLPPNNGHNKRKLDADASTDDHHMNSSTVILTTPTAATTELNAQDSLILLEPRQKKLKPSSVQ